MSSPAGEKGKAPEQPDTSLSGILTRSQKPSASLDLQYIKVAVDLQNLDAEDADEKLQASLDNLLKASSVDTAFIALFDDQTTRIERLIVSKTAFSQSAAEVLKGKELEELSWFRARLRHLRVIEIADTADAASSNADAAFLAERHIGSILLTGFDIADGLQGNLRAFLLTKQLFFVGLALGNVEFDTDQAAHVARFCPQGEHTAMHPPPTACTMPHAMSALETVGVPIHISTHFALNATQVIRVHQVPPIGGIRQLVLGITQHGFPAW